MNWLREPDTEPIPGYRLLEPLGTGGFGEVWKCVAPGGIYKAIKFVYGNLNSLDGDAHKAEQEQKALEQVKVVRHPFVLSMDRIEVVSGELLIVMELADKSLFDLLQECQQAGRPGIPREMLLGFLADTAEGLDHLIERHNLQHLDVKPKNLFLIADRVKVADFGLVKHLERQSASGIMGGITPVYAAPETFANKISKHSDQYSLAVVFVELLTGRRPFAGKNIRQLAVQHMTEPPDLHMLPEADRAAVAKALAKNPDDRFPSCSAFVRALGGGSLRADVTIGLGHHAVETPAPTNGRRPATAPDLDLGATVQNQVRPRRATPPPVTANAAARFAILPDPHNTMSVSVSIRPEEGVLRPAMLIGVGSFGRRALQQIRCRLVDRIGELAQVPCFRFVYLDADPETMKRAANGPPDAVLMAEHVFHAPLQPVTAYRRRQLDHILEWLPREKLYTIPRSLKVEGSRALGRLAFADHYLRFMTRMRHEVQVSTHPEALRQSSDQTGMQVRSKVPAVYVFASASGGTSGMLVDVGHAVRRALERFNIPDAPMTAFVFTGAPDDPSSPPEELANIFATLTELNHYADPDVAFAAQYGGPEGPQVEGRGLPFTATYLLPMARRDADAFRDCVSHLAGYVAHDLTTPLGAGLEKLRKAPTPVGRTPFRGFGTFGVWFPRGLLLRSAARQLCVRFLRTWADGGNGKLPAEANQVLQLVLSDTRLTPEEIQPFIAAESSRGDGNPAEYVRSWAAGLTGEVDAATRRSDPYEWAAAAWDQARESVGLEPTTDADSPFRRGRLSRALDRGITKALEAWENELVELLRPLEELSGPRLSAAMAVVAELITACSEAAAAVEKQLIQLAESRRQAKAEVQAALAAAHGIDGPVTFALFGNRAGRALRGVADKVRQYTEVRVREDLATAAARFYRKLRAWFDEKVRDLGLARSRLAELTKELEAHVLLSASGITTAPPLPTEADDSTQTTMQGSNTMRVVLPYGEDRLDRSAAEMLELLPAEERDRLELVLTRLVVEPRGGLAGACRGSMDLMHYLGDPMIEQATAVLSGLLPGEDVTAVELSGEGAAELSGRLAQYVQAAAPLVGGPPEEERTFVMLPDTEAGQQYAEEVRKAVPAATVVPVLGPGTDLLFCREHGCLRTADLFKLLEPCWEAFHQAAANVEHNPHSRFDVGGWMPLVE
ncbi:MAG TPA: tubulin-like doman-containing protein [Fimbriiglobus sp.]|nr:tubulin-like doman-containing protein [Fimbriiglobus sp.]